jgi:hypothetical protein
MAIQTVPASESRGVFSNEDRIPTTLGAHLSARRKARELEPIKYETGTSGCDVLTTATGTAEQLIAAGIITAEHLPKGRRRQRFEFVASGPVSHWSIFKLVDKKARVVAWHRTADGDGIAEGIRDALLEQLGQAFAEARKGADEWAAAQPPAPLPPPIVFGRFPLPPAVFGVHVRIRRGRPEYKAAPRYGKAGAWSPRSPLAAWNAERERAYLAMLSKGNRILRLPEVRAHRATAKEQRDAEIVSAYVLSTLPEHNRASWVAKRMTCTARHVRAVVAAWRAQQEKSGTH